MNKKFSKILGVVAVIALLASFLAAPVSADVSQPTVSIKNEEISADTEYTITFDVTDEVVRPYSFTTVGVDSTAEWVDADTIEPCAGDYSLKLYALEGHAGGAAVYIPVNVAIKDIDSLSFARLGTAGNKDAKVNLLIDADNDGDLDFTAIEALEFHRTLLDNPFGDDAMLYLNPMELITNDGWTTVDVYSTYKYFGADKSTITSPDMLYWTHDRPFGVSGGVREVGSGIIDPTDKVLGVIVLLGCGSGVADQTVYIDDIKINDTTYDLEPDAAITIEFPEGTVIDKGTEEDPFDIADVTVRSTAGFGTDNPSTPVGDCVFTTVDDDVYTVTIDLARLPNNIGEGARVRVKFLGETITNPSEPGDYTLWVSTSAETDAVESETYTIEVPEIPGLEGVIEVYNPSGVLMDHFHSIQLALKEADEDWTIKIGEGLYIVGDLTTADLNDGHGATDVTIEGSGDVEDIIIEGTWTIEVDTTGITLDGVTLDGGGEDNALIVNATDFTIQNCILEGADDYLIDIVADEEDDPTVIDNCTFNIEDETGILAGGVTEISDSTFTIDEDGDGIGIEINAVSPNDITDITVEDCTFNGGSGTGVEVKGGDSAIEGCTFDGLLTAFVIEGGTVDIFGGTIKNCEEEAIDIDIGGEADLVTIHNNTITGCNDEVILFVDDGAENVFMMFNTITKNAGDDDGLLIDNDSGGELYVINNWWGDADGPSQGDDAFSGDDVIRKPFLPGPIENSAIETDVAKGDTADFKKVCGVQVDNDATTNVPLEIVGAAQFTTNPVAAIDDAVAFWDVCVIDVNENGGDVDKVTIRLYTDVTETTKVYVWGAARGEWLEADATPNLFGGFMTIVVGANTTPTLDDLAALPFVVVEPPEGTAEAVKIEAPLVGATDVSTTPTLAWTVVDDATYEVQIAQDATFAILDEAATSPTNAYIVTTALAEGQSYYWRVRAVTDAGAGDWATGVFTTAKAEPEPTPPVEIVEAPGPPEITIEMPQTVTQAIAPGLLWAIIGVGAVLVIALIVLIVRTRRVV